MTLPDHHLRYVLIVLHYLALTVQSGDVLGAVVVLVHLVRLSSLVVLDVDRGSEGVKLLSKHHVQTVTYGDVVQRLARSQTALGARRGEHVRVWVGTHPQ